MKNNGFQKDRRSHTVLTVVFTIIAIAYLYPIFIVLVNSLKSNAAINLEYLRIPGFRYPSWACRTISRV